MNYVKNIKLGAPINYGDLGIKRRIKIILKNVNLKGKYLLDVGCSNGAQTLEFLKYCKKCIGIDVEDNRLMIFKKNLKENDIKNCEVKLMNIVDLKFSNKTFDAVTCIETLEHIPDQETALREIHRVLKSGGHLIMSVPNKWWIFKTHGANLPLLPWNRMPFFSWLPKKIHDRYAYARIYTKKEIMKLIRAHGFKIYNIEYMMPPLDKLKNRFIQKILRKLLFTLERTKFGIFGVSIFIFANKQ